MGTGMLDTREDNKGLETSLWQVSIVEITLFERCVVSQYIRGMLVIFAHEDLISNRGVILSVSLNIFIFT